MKKKVNIFQSIIKFLFGFIFGIIITTIIKDKVIENEINKTYKFKLYYNLLNSWLRLKIDKIDIKEYFYNNHYKTIAIYGMGEIGNRLYEELRKTDITIKYAIDEGANNSFSELEIISPNDEFEVVDIIVITPIFDIDEIKKRISNKSNLMVLSIEDIINSFE